MSKAAAIALASRFAATKDGRQEAFPSIKTTRRLYGSSLVHRVNNPDAVSQGMSSLCGPASLMYMLLLKRPDVYVQYAIDLYVTGKASIGRLRITPGDGCRRSSAGGMAPVDWITLASLRDSSNDLFAYDSPSDEFAGITLPGSLTGWDGLSGRDCSRT